MKTAISLPDQVFQEAERFARKTKRSRSQLYSEALAEYLSRHSTNDITNAMNDACDKIGQSDQSFSKAASKRIFEKEQW